MNLWRKAGKKDSFFPDTARRITMVAKLDKRPLSTGSRVQSSKPRPTHGRQTGISSFQENRKCLVTPCACVHPFGSHCYTPSSSEKAEAPAHAGPGTVSPVPLPLRMRCGLASCCEAERKDRFFFFFLLFPPLFFPHLPRTGPEISLGLVGPCDWLGPARAC